MACKTTNDCSCASKSSCNGRSDPNAANFNFLAMQAKARGPGNADWAGPWMAHALEEARKQQDLPESPLSDLVKRQGRFEQTLFVDHSHSSSKAATIVHHDWSDDPSFAGGYWDGPFHEDEIPENDPRRTPGKPGREPTKEGYPFERPRRGKGSVRRRCCIKEFLYPQDYSFSPGGGFEFTVSAEFIDENTSADASGEPDGPDNNWGDSQEGWDFNEVICKCHCCRFRQLVVVNMVTTFANGTSLTINTEGEAVEDCILVDATTGKQISHPDPKLGQNVGMTSAYMVSAATAAAREASDGDDPSRELVGEVLAEWMAAILSQNPNAEWRCYGDPPLSDGRLPSLSEYQGERDCKFFMCDKPSPGPGQKRSGIILFIGQILDDCRSSSVIAESQFALQYVDGEAVASTGTGESTKFLRKPNTRATRALCAKLALAAVTRR